MKQELIKPKVHDYHDKSIKFNFNNYIEACRWILENHQCLVINSMLVDAQTANAIITVYDALGKEQQEKVLFIPIKKFANFSWKQVTLK